MPSKQRTSSLGHPPSTRHTPQASSHTSPRCLRNRRQQALALMVLPMLGMPSLAAAAAVAAGGAAVGVAVPAAVPAAAAAVPVAAGAGAGAGAPAAAVAVADQDPLVDPVASAVAVAISSTIEAVVAASAAPGSTKAKYDTGSAPVDGKDGRPHEGPFVETESTRKGGAAAAEEKEPKTNYIVDGKKIPESNDGVMDDKNRAAPKEGTTGTSGGVSEKDKQRKAQEGQTGERVEKAPEAPKEAPPMPHHEEKKINGGKDSKEEKAKDTDGADGAAGFGKPADLPDMTHDTSIPVPGSAKKDHLDVPSTSSNDKAKLPKHSDGDEESQTLIQPLHSFLLSLTMILFSEVGDKTFLVAALMAMKHDRMVVFSAAFSALFTMTILSAVLGHAVPVLIPKRITNFLAAGLFLVFGARMMREGMAMGANEGVGAEMQEVELELAEKEHLARENGRRRGDGGVLSADVLEMGIGSDGRQPRQQSRYDTPNRSASSSVSPPRGRGNWRISNTGGPLGTLRSVGGGVGNLASLLLSPAWVQTFVMTFLGEWGDRSQIATLAMAAGQDYWWVTWGAVTGHACCTAVAVIGGRAVAGRVSLKVVTIGGAVSFLLFGIIYLVEAFYA